MERLNELLTPETKVLALTHISNSMGTINPLKEIVERAHQNNTVVVIDGAQGIPHMPVHVQELDIDFLAFSGHKVLGPTGVGVLYAKPEFLEEMDPVQFGGDMILDVDYFHSTWNEIPWKFEGGTQNIAGVIGLGAAIDYVSGIGLDRIFAHDQYLTQYALDRLSETDELKIFGPLKNRGPAISFSLGHIHPHDLATWLDQKNIAIRSGHHCAQLVMKKLGVPATARISFYLYNTKHEIDRFIEMLYKAKDYFSRWL
jgi:cysteine desulfurase/selenocysteine lyase